MFFGGMVSAPGGRGDCYERNGFSAEQGREAARPCTPRSLFLEKSDQKSAAELLRSKPPNHSVRHGGCRLSALRSMG